MIYSFSSDMGFRLLRR